MICSRTLIGDTQQLVFSVNVLEIGVGHEDRSSNVKYTNHQPKHRFYLVLVSGCSQSVLSCLGTMLVQTTGAPLRSSQQISGMTKFRRCDPIRSLS